MLIKVVIKQTANVNKWSPLLWELWEPCKPSLPVMMELSDEYITSHLEFLKAYPLA